MPSQNMILDALQASGNSQNVAATQQNRFTQILQEMGVLTGATTSAIEKGTTATNVVEQQTLKGAQDAQDATQATARRAGVDNSNPEDILATLGEELRVNIERSKAARANIDAKSTMNPFDNPVGWLHGQLTIKADQNRYEVASKSAAGISKDIAQVTSAVDEMGRTRAALAIKITDASRAAAADVRIAEGEAAKAAAQRGYLKDEMTVAGAIQNASAAQAQEVQRQLQIVVSEEQRAMEAEKFKMYKEQYNWELQSKKLNAVAKQEGENIKGQLLAQYNLGAQVLGQPLATNWDFVKAKAELGGTDAGRISAAMEAGGNSIAAGGRAVVSATPGGAASMIARNLYTRGNDAGFEPMKKYLKDTLNAKVALGGKEEQILANTNAQIKLDAELYAKDAVATGSFYAPPPLQSILDTKSVRATALYQKVLATSGKDLTTAAPTPVIKLAYAAAKAGTITYEQAAAGIAEMYGQAVNINNSEKRFSQIGIAPQKGFNVSPDIPGLNVKADLTNYTSNLHLLATMKAREQIAFTQSVMSGTPLGSVVAPASEYAKSLFK